MKAYSMGRFQRAALLASGEWFGPEDRVRPPMPEGHMRACGCPECVPHHQPNEQEPR